MKIALIYDAVYPYIKGGGEKRFYEIAKKLSNNGHEVHIYGMKLWPGKKIIKKDVKYISKYNSISIHYNENDFYSIEKIINYQKQINKTKLDFSSKPEKIDELIQKRYDETNICDFENIIQKLCESNTQFKEKLTKL